MGSRSLYICYFGVREPLVQTQVLPYLRELVKGGHELSLLTFESLENDGNGEIRYELASDGIEWHWLRYHKRPSVPATLFDIANGARLIRKLLSKKKFDILHSRSHVPMMMAALARRASGRKPKLLFDIRGFMPEEYVDAGIWPEGGAIYRNVKRAEKWLVSESDAFVVLTEVAREIMAETFGDRPVEVIPCCVDLERFATATEASRSEIREKLGIGDRFTLAYVGAFGGWYLTEQTADFFGVVKKKKPNSFALILTQSDPGMIRPLLVMRGFSENEFFIGKVPSAEIPKYLSAADAAVSFIKECFSKKASSPTKNAEYLACGLPIVVNDGIGDTTDLTTADGVGPVLYEFTDAGYERAIEEIERMTRDRDGTAERCRESARKRFDLESVGGTRYRNLYERILSNR